MRHAHSRAAFALAAGLIALLAVAGCRSTGGGAPSGQRSEAFVRVEGSLVLARLRDDPTAFRRAIAELPQMLLGGRARPFA